MKSSRRAPKQSTFCALQEFDFLMKSQTERVRGTAFSERLNAGLRLGRQPGVASGDIASDKRAGHVTAYSNATSSTGESNNIGVTRAAVVVFVFGGGCGSQATRASLGTSRLGDWRHPDEDTAELCNFDFWFGHENEDGVFENECEIRKAIFFRGVHPEVRRHVWPFLLFVYPFSSSQSDRDRIRARNVALYRRLSERRRQLTPEQREAFYRDFQCTIEKDVVRTDRGNPFYAGDDNSNVEKMKEILLNYAVYNPRVGYTQGMSDLLAPILFEIRDEAETFWCFAGLMQRSSFVSCPTDTDMDRNLNLLRGLLKMFSPSFYDHLSHHLDALELLFVHRWLLLCFKREFPAVQSLVIWEACWSQWLTAHFHLFVCTAIIAVYGHEAVQKRMTIDEMLLHFSSLAMHMDARIVLRKVYKRHPHKVPPKDDVKILGRSGFMQLGDLEGTKLLLQPTNRSPVLVELKKRHLPAIFLF